MRVRDKATNQQDRSVPLTDTPLGFSQSMTREGFLLCKDVPIARTGWQDYLNDEIVGEDDKDNPLYPARSTHGVIRAERREEDVFRPETLASFEGKPVVDDHPEDPVHPGNFKQHVVGVTLNVRRGEGPMSDFIIADLLLMDQAAIDAVRAGKREVSCGYDAEYEHLGTGRVRQYDIIGNHVALVDRGRCGSRCAIGDKEIDMKEKTAKGNGIVARLRRAFAARDQAAFDKAVEGMDEDETEGMDDEQASEKETMSATGTHIHLHLGGEEQASGKDPATAGADDDADDDAEGEEGEGEKSAAAGNVEARVAKLEAGMQAILQSLEKIAARMGGGDKEEAEEEAEGDGAMQGEEEAEGNVPEADADETEEGEKEKSKDKSKDKTKDAAKVKDSSGLKNDFTDAKSGAEILAPGLKMPTFDRAAKPQTTKDAICLLKRRALAQAARDEKNGGKEVVQTMLGKKPLAGLDCAAVDTVFNGAVALMQDRNGQDDPKVKARGAAKDKGKAPQSPRDFNAAMREKHGQPKPR